MESNNEQDLKALQFDVMLRLRFNLVKAIEREMNDFIIYFLASEPYDKHLERLNKLIDTLERIY